MRIAVIIDSVVKGDGQGRVTYEVVQRALKQGQEITLLADRVDPALVAGGARWIPVSPRLREPALAKEAEFAWRADRLLDTVASEVDVTVATGAVVRRSPHHVNVAHFVHRAWRDSPANPSREGRSLANLYRRAYTSLNVAWETAAFGLAECVVAVSEFVRDHLVAGGVPGEKVRVIHNGADTQTFHPGLEDRRSLGLPKSAPLALFVGDIATYRKNLDSVLYALQTLPDLHLAVAGRTEGSPFPALAARLGVESRVHFLGFRRDTDRLFRAADVFAFPSRYEACSLVLLEAIASGLPVVTAATAGGCEILTEDCGVVLSDPDDVEALAGALRAVVSDPERRRRMSQAAREVAERYTWERMADQYLTLFREVGQTS